MTTISTLVQKTYNHLVALEKVIAERTYDFDPRVRDAILKKLEHDSKEMVREQHAFTSTALDPEIMKQTRSIIDKIRSSDFIQTLGKYQTPFIHVLNTIENNVKETPQKVQKVDLGSK